MDHYAETFETWNKLAQLYQDKFMHLALYNETYDYICRAIQEPKARVLELGCGPGNITKYLLTKQPDWDILGLDISPNMIDLARRNNPEAKFEVMDVRDISSLKAQYDGIVCGFCLPYLAPEDGHKLILDCANLLHDQGILYLSFVEGDPANATCQVGSSGDKVYFLFYTLENLRQQLTKYNFEELATYKLPYTNSKSETETHTVVVAKKGRPRAPLSQEK
jgi:2-polyprenyl-3-methyl-5-hydroxy-6-metoxy-1,4-benzoquinol methylase